MSPPGFFRSVSRPRAVREAAAVQGARSAYAAVLVVRAPVACVRCGGFRCRIPDPADEYAFRNGPFQEIRGDCAGCRCRRRICAPAATAMSASRIIRITAGLLRRWRAAGSAGPAARTARTARGRPPDAFGEHVPAVPGTGADDSYECMACAPGPGDARRIREAAGA